jgi:hypothetical protein
LVPIFGAAVPYRRTSAGRQWLIIVAMGMLMLDLIIVVFSMAHGWTEVEKVVRLGPLTVALWAFCWLGWQILALLVIAEAYLRRFG